MLTECVTCNSFSVIFPFHLMMRLPEMCMLTMGCVYVWICVVNYKYVVLLLLLLLLFGFSKSFLWNIRSNIRAVAYHHLYVLRLCIAKFRFFGERKKCSMPCRCTTACSCFKKTCELWWIIDNNKRDIL